MIKAVLFDLDGVLTTGATGTTSKVKYMDKKTKCDVAVFEKAYRKHNWKLLYGQTTHETIWQQVCDEINEDMSIDVLLNAFDDTPMDYKMLSIAKMLKSKGYKIAMVTDNKVDRVQKILSFNGLEDLFDEVIISATIGSGKKHFPIFEETIKVLKVSYESCVLIDNNKENLIVPGNKGMETIYFDHHVRDHEKLVKQLNSLLLTTISL